jgi:hypothetical protein
MYLSLSTGQSNLLIYMSVTEDEDKKTIGGVTNQEAVMLFGQDSL